MFIELNLKGKKRENWIMDSHLDISESYDW